MPSQTKSGKKRFRFIERSDTKLSNGRKGKRRIQIVGGKTDIPSKEELKSAIAKETGGEFDPLESTIEPIVITTDWLINKDLDLGMKIVPNSSMKDSKVSRNNKDIAFFQAAANNPLFDQKEVAKDFAKAFDKDVERVMAKEDNTQNAMAEASGLPGLAGMKGQPAPSQTPEINTEIL